MTCKDGYDIKQTCPRQNKKHTKKRLPFLIETSPFVRILRVNILNTGVGLVQPSSESVTEPMDHPNINSAALNTMHHVLVVIDYCEV